MHIPIGRELTEQLAKGGALHSRPIEKLTRPLAAWSRRGRGCRAGPRVAVVAEQSFGEIVRIGIDGERTRRCEPIK
jgi:hypothetical protein